MTSWIRQKCPISLKDYSTSLTCLDYCTYKVSISYEVLNLLAVANMSGKITSGFMGGSTPPYLFHLSFSTNPQRRKFIGHFSTNLRRHCDVANLSKFVGDEWRKYDLVGWKFKILRNVISNLTFKSENLENQKFECNFEFYLQWNLSMADMIYSGHIFIADTLSRNQLF